MEYVHWFSWNCLKHQESVSKTNSKIVKITFGKKGTFLTYGIVNPKVLRNSDTLRLAGDKTVVDDQLYCSIHALPAITSCKRITLQNLAHTSGGGGGGGGAGPPVPFIMHTLSPMTLPVCASEHGVM